MNRIHDSFYQGTALILLGVFGLLWYNSWLSSLLGAVVAFSGFALVLSNIRDEE